MRLFVCHIKESRALAYCLLAYIYCLKDRCPLCHDILYRVETEVREEEITRGLRVADPLIPPLPADDIPR